MRKWAAVVIAAGAAVTLLAACASGTSGTATPRPPGPTARPSGPTASHPAVAVAVPAATSAPSTAPSKATPKPRPEPKPKPVNHCAHNSDAQKVIVSVGKQHAWLCARRTAVYDTAITTGIVGEWTSTPTGDYQIQGRSTDTVLTLNTGAQYDVNYWIPFDAPLFGFHDSSWQNFPYGSARYKTEGSHGCIHMPLKAMAFLYKWVAEPTSVHIS